MRTLEVEIEGSKVSFAGLGRQFRLDCVSHIRGMREASCERALNGKVDDPITAMSRASAVLETYSKCVIIKDADVDAFLETPDGVALTFGRSFDKANPDATAGRAEQLLDEISNETFGQLRDFWGEQLYGSFYADKVQQINAFVADVNRKAAEPDDESEEIIGAE